MRKRLLFVFCALVVVTGAYAGSLGTSASGSLWNGVVGNAGNTGHLNNPAGCTSLCGANLIDWNLQGLGTAPAVWSTPQGWTGSDGSTGQIGVVGPTNFTYMVQGSTWFGNFNPGDGLIWNQDIFNQTGNAGPIGVLFNNPVSEVSTQVQADFFGAFTATVNAFDSMGNLIDTFSEIGNSNGNGDGSAIFIGLNEGVANITFFTVSVVDINGNNNEAINQVWYDSGSTTTPEPGSVLLLGSGLLGLAAYGRRRFGR